MKRIFAILLAAAMLLSGCTTSDGGETTAPTQPETMATVPEGPISFANAGKVKIPYDGKPGYVLYVTSPEQLPEHESLAAFDEIFFRTHAIVLVVETVNSGSIQLEIESIVLEDGVATVNLARELKGEVGTSDMATWMIWAVVPAGLDCQWALGGTTDVDRGEKY